MMKKRFQWLLLTLLCLVLLSACEKERIITADQLPEPVKTYIQKNHPGLEVTYVKKDSEFFSTKYEVMLENGMKIEFNKDGEPVDIDMYD